MKILSQCALAGVLFSVAQACATPVDISDDIQQVNPDSLGDDGGVPGGGSGGSAGNGGIGQGGSGPSGAGGTGSSGSSGAGGQLGGAGGTSGGASGAGGAGGSTGGAGGAAGTGGTGGTGSGSVFDPEACDFESITGCEAFACATACPANMGTYCTDTCNAIITCVSESTPLCATEADPVCGIRTPGGVDNECTTQTDSGGGAPTTDQNSPTFKAQRFIECLCSVPRG